MKTKKSKAGFTLVELIVVIAILGILAGVGTVAYSGYITAANKNVDRETVGNLINAATLADYANPGLFTDGSSAMIVLSEDGTRAAGTSDAAKFAAALSDAVDDLAGLKLKYGKWLGAVDGATLNSMVQSLKTIGYMGDDGTIKITDENGNPLTASYAASADELWELVEQVAKEYEAKGSGKSAAEFLYKAAEYTTQDTISGAVMGNAWASVDLATALETASSVDGSSDGSQAGAVAPQAACMARNHAFAEYLRTHYSVSEALVQSLRQGGDLVCNFQAPNPGSGGEFAADWPILHEAAQAYISGGENGGKSQAYADGMIYYALMHNIKTETDKGTFDTGSDSYMDDISGYVSVAGKAFSGTVDWNSMVQTAEALEGAGTTVVIYVTKSGDNLSFSVNPSDADPRDGSEGGGEEVKYTSSVTLTLDKDNRTLTSDINSIAISTETGYSMCRLNYVSVDATQTVNASAFNYEISDETVAIYSEGVITAVGKGTATIKITSTGRDKSTTTLDITVR